MPVLSGKNTAHSGYWSAFFGCQAADRSLFSFPRLPLNKLRFLDLNPFFTWRDVKTCKKDYFAAR